MEAAGHRIPRGIAALFDSKIGTKPDSGYQQPCADILQ